MNKISYQIASLGLLLCGILFSSCEQAGPFEPQDPIGDTIAPVEQLTATPASAEGEIALTWKNPADEDLLKIEITYQLKVSAFTTKAAVAIANPALVDGLSGENSALTIKVPTLDTYLITATAINKAGVKSDPVQVEGTPYIPTELERMPVLLKWADTLMTSITQLFLDGKPRDIWSSTYPQSDGYWDGAAVIWGHGAAFSGYTTLRGTAENFPQYQASFTQKYDERLLTAIDQFRNTRNGGAEAYAVYPGEGDERYFDDNIWVGIDMVDLYEQTQDARYLERAELVWNFVETGTDEVMGGGVYWKEGGNSKNTCSTAPAAVLAAKLYLATNEPIYLESARSLYAWCKEILQDPDDYLYWDNARLSDENDPNSPIQVDKAKFSYNAGQPMQAAVLLHRITGEGHYLIDAQNIARSAYARWFIPFNSYTLGESFQILEPGHVWFQAIMLRGFVELYKTDGDRTYVTAYEKTLANAWLSNCRNPQTNLLNSDFRGGTTQTQWEILHEGACVEMLARLAALSERDY